MWFDDKSVIFPNISLSVEILGFQINHWTTEQLIQKEKKVKKR
jgi:hypothetical protein